jgi:hypothetical protein
VENILSLEKCSIRKLFEISGEKMIKKCLLLLILLGIITGGVFAQSKSESKSWYSIGAGGYFSSDFGGGVQTSSSSKKETPYIGGGAFAFFDATYGQLSVGMFSVNGEMDEERSLFGVDFTLLGKFPFQIDEYFSLFPLLGLEYHLVLTAIDSEKYQYKNDGYQALLDFSALWFKAGAGLDFSFNKTLYLRGELLYGLRIANKYELDSVAAIGSSAAPLLGHGLNIRLALGYRFY